jgi:transcriptional regulator with XRE-family HTH domain
VGFVKRFDPTKIREARHKRGLSQSQLARLCDIPEQNIGRWERGDNTPYGDNLAHLAEALNEPLEFFYTDDTPDDMQEVRDRRGMENVA